MNYDMKECGKRIRQLRMESGLTQEKAASELNIDRSFYNRIETGKKGALSICLSKSRLYTEFLSIILSWENILMIHWITWAKPG